MAAAAEPRMKAGGPVLGPSDQICPDPSAHKHPKGANLSDKAADAALHSHPERAGEVRTPINPLDPDGRLSSASAAMSLKYARAHELPSFPSVGIDRHMSPASAANLAHKNQKPFEHWKPDPSTNASKAALLAKDYKMAPLWQPQASAAGSKAALLAHSGPGREWWQPESTKDGNAAASMAMKNNKLSPQAYAGATENDKMNALLAATAVNGRKRSGSTPAPALYPDAANAQRNSLYAATSADANRMGSRAMEASRVHNLGKNVTPKMFTEQPPIAWEVADKKHDDALQASAISMAKQMYAVQKVNDDGTITINDGQAAARSANNNRSSTASSDIHQQALQYISLQDAAQKLAAERLAKIHHPDETAAFRDWYGYPQQKPRSRMSMRAPKNRQRASSEGGSWDADSSDDERQASRIRSRQSQLTNQLAEVDATKRDEDRKKLMAAAEKRVHAQMVNMDRKVYDDTGKMTQAMVEDWDAKARARAAAASEARMQNHGKVAIGGGQWMDQSAIDAIALARVKPTLDQISAQAEKQRIADDEARMDAEMEKRQAREEKTRAAGIKAEHKRIKNLERDEEKARKAEEKRLAREEKDADKYKRAEEKRIVKEEKRKSKDTGGLTEVSTANAAIIANERPTTANTVSTVDSDVEDLEPSVSASSVPITAHRTASRDTPVAVVAPIPHATTAEQHEDHAIPSTEEADSPKLGKSRFGSLLHKLKPKSTKTKESGTTASSTGEASKLHKNSAPNVNDVSIPHHDAPRSPSPDLPDSDDELYAEPSNTKPVVADGAASKAEKRGRTTSRHSSLATDDFEEARDTLVAPPPEPAFASQGSQSPNRGSKFHEEV